MSILKYSEVMQWSLRQILKVPEVQQIGYNMRTSALPDMHVYDLNSIRAAALRLQAYISGKALLSML